MPTPTMSTVTTNAPISTVRSRTCASPLALGLDCTCHRPAGHRPAHSCRPHQGGGSRPWNPGRVSFLHEGQHAFAPLLGGEEGDRLFGQFSYFMADRPVPPSPPG